jgi:predicted glycosyltransferase
MAWMLRKPGIIFEDTESAKKVIWIYKLFAEIILTPSCFRSNLGAKQIRIDSYKESAYLHNKYFNLNKSIFEQFNIPIKHEYILIRFVSHKVNHDKTSDGLSFEMKQFLVNKLVSISKVYISNEKGLISPFPELELQIAPEKIHDVIAFSKLVVGESATMSAEAAMLGVPSIFFDNYGRGYTDELEYNFKLVNNYKISQMSIINAINKIKEIINTRDYINCYTGYQQLKNTKIDLTAFLVWFIENYPESVKIIRENPKFQFHFK